MIRKLNRKFQDYMRPKRLAFGKWIWDRKKVKEVLKIEEVKSILILRYDGKIGDMVVTTLLFREIKKKYPKIKIGVVAEGVAIDIIKGNSYVDKIYNYEEKNIVCEIKNEKYDVLIDFSHMLRVTQMKFIKKCGARINMGYKKNGWKLFDENIEMINKKHHISEVYNEALKKLSIENSNLSYDLQITNESLKRIEKYKGCIVFNPFAASKHRSFGIDKIKKIIEILIKEYNKDIVILAMKQHEKLIDKIVLDDKTGKIFKGKFESIVDVIAIVRESSLVVTPDTSIVHIATAFQKPTIAIYREDKEGEENIALWGPNSKFAKIVVVKDNSKSRTESGIDEFEIDELRGVKI